MAHSGELGLRSGRALRYDCLRFFVLFIRVIAITRKLQLKLLNRLDNFINPQVAITINYQLLAKSFFEFVTIDKSYFE